MCKQITKMSVKYVRNPSADHQNCVDIWLFIKVSFICSNSFLLTIPDVTRYACDLCDKKFSHKSGLLCHVKQTHSSSPKKHVCRICQMSFTKVFIVAIQLFHLLIQLSNLDRHIRNIHPIDSNRTLFDCSYCLCQFSTSAALQKHVNQCHPDHGIFFVYYVVYIRN